jgi:hypothetical protein
MTLKIIGAGYGRTGTSSIRQALDDLGYPCYHMADVLFNPANKADVDFWQEVADGDPMASHDWDRVFGRYSATVDYPACAAWRALVRDHPEAKVLLTLHPKGAEAWYDSCLTTIYAGTDLDSATDFGARINGMMDQLIWKGMMQGTMEHRDQAIARYEAHIAEVKAEVPADRLLVFTATDGWEPLCAFLGHPVPEAPFPNVNNREHMAQVMNRMRRVAMLSKAASRK